MERCSKRKLSEDLETIASKAFKTGYHFSPRDVFALGYLCGKYNLKKILKNQEKVINACKEYDKTDDLMLLDTIGETLIDLKVISNKKNII